MPSDSGSAIPKSRRTNYGPILATALAAAGAAAIAALTATGHGDLVNSAAYMGAQGVFEPGMWVKGNIDTVETLGHVGTAVAQAFQVGASRAREMDSGATSARLLLNTVNQTGAYLASLVHLKVGCGVRQLPQLVSDLRRNEPARPQASLEL